MRAPATVHGWLLAGLLLGVLGVGGGRAQSTPDANHDSRPGEFEAGVPGLATPGVPAAEDFGAFAPEFRRLQGVPDGSNDSRYAGFAGEFRGRAQVTPGQPEELGLGDDDLFGDDLDLGGETPDLAPDPLPGFGDPEPAPVLAAGGPGAATPSGPLVGLAQLAARAVVASGLVKRAGHGAKAARRAVEEADALQWPKLSVMALGRESNHRDRIARLLGQEQAPKLAGPLSMIRNDAAFVTGFDVTAPLYRGGLFGAREDIARQDEDVARLRELQAVEEVLLRLVDLYLEVLLGDAAVEVEAERERQLALEQGEKVSRVSEPFVRDQLALESELELARARSRRGELEGRRDLARARLEALVGEGLPDGFRLEASFSVAPGPGRAEDLKQRARKGNLEVRVQVAKANVARMKVSEVASTEQPTVDLDYQYRYSSPNPTDRVDSAYWYASVRMDFPVFDGGVVRSRKRQARERKSNADLLVQETVARVEAEAGAAFAAEVRASAALASANRLVELARRNARAVQDRVDKGSLGPADAARARVALLQSRISALDAQAELVRARTRMHALAGALVLDKFQ